MGLRKKIKRLLFIKNNRNDITALLTLRAKIVFLDILSLQNKILTGVIYYGLALVFFLLMVLSLLFGLNSFIEDADTKKIVFLSVAVLSLALFLLLVLRATQGLTSACRAVGDSVRDLTQELRLGSGAQDEKKILSELERTFTRADPHHED